ncbi:hypothetical protein MPOCJGCO_4241 [Methylobacterium trifolii]|uniref:Uncharacterized protein n=2 Tax=Methylobacterium trifolii TaxID=1003092 RepID=A0ABQ4U4C5_9HYPH|nr:hypothetical protein MPOCJGCO_4241 [Methylobacterium trifolii]
MQTAIVLPAPGAVPAPIAPPPIARSKVTAPKAVADKEPAASTSPNPIILFGLDQRGRAHAACFVGGDTLALERAADAMDLFFVVAETDALRDLAAKLAVGRLFPASGKAFVPFTSAPLYDRLLAAAGITDAPRPLKAAGKFAEAGGGAGAKPGGASGGSGAGDPPATRAGAKAPADHSQIGIGSLVLAQGDDEEDEGYYAAKVIATKADDAFVLTWAEYPDLPEFGRSRRALALLHPEAAE